MASLLFSRLVRKKYISAKQVTDTKLDRCLSTLDLTALGIGSTLGLGIYVLAGKVSREQSGPSVALAFLIAAIASVFAGLCYAEFGARVPRAGSAYVYSYVTVGEFIAFIIGWNLVMEYVIGTSSVAKGYSGYLDFLVDYKINITMEEAMPIRISGLADYPDFLASGITILLTIVLAVGVKESSRFNNVCTLVNLLVVVYVIVCGSFKADTHNWNMSEEEVEGLTCARDTSGNTHDCGTGGFFPYGFAGTLAGAATCFYGFVGFDCIATTGEEVKNPQRAIPVSIVVSLLCIFLAYFGISTILTLMWPYYDQNVTAPLPYVFDKVGWPVAKWIVSVGALAGLSTSLLGAMFPLPRVFYAMASDGLIFRFLAKIHPSTKTPLYSTILGGIIAAVMALLFSLPELIDMMSIGTLMAYTLVAASVLVLRYTYKDPSARNCMYTPLLQEANYLTYKPAGDFSDDEITAAPDIPVSDEYPIMPPSTSVDVTTTEILRQCFNLSRQLNPTPLSFAISKVSVALIGLFSVTTAAFISFARDQLSSGLWWVVTLTAISVFCLVMTCIVIALQPQVKEQLYFKVPWVPLLPAGSMIFNIVLMLQLSYMTWVRFAVWLAIGLAIYFTYGIRNSSEEYRRRGLQPPDQDEPAEPKEGVVLPEKEPDWVH